MEFRVLGPLEVTDGGAPLQLGGPKQRAVLAILLLHAGEVIPAERIVDELWGEDPPPTAAKTLRIYVSRLRKLLGDALATRASGYAIELEPDALDLAQLERLREAGRLHEALELFRGPPLADFAYETWAQGPIARLEELRLATLEDRIDADLAGGLHAELVGEIEQLVAQHPLRERLRGQLMLALYRSGRQAEALQAYTAARETLVEELGIDPSPELQQLERAILNQDPSLASPARVRPSRIGDGLPTPQTRLVGRARELAELTDLLCRDDVPLVTLTGPGGTGKTRLSLALAWEQSERFRDGTVFCGLAAARDAETVLSTIASRLRLREEGGRSFAELLSEHLAERETLLVLDNLEQVIEAAPTIASLLAGAPGLKIVATSRAPLRIAGERRYPVSPLEPGPAVELFAERAQAVKPEFRLDDGNATAIEEICRRLDGLPLALELAAARLAILSPAALAERLGESLTLLAAGRRDADERQRTLRDTIAWSYDLLDSSPRQLFEELAVFSGGFTLEAAEAVCTTDEVLAGLAELVDGNLVRERDLDGQPWFFMLGTIREYAQERLTARDELDRRHAEYYAGLAEQAAAGLRTDAAAWMRRLEREHANFVQALEWASSRDEAELELRLAGSLRVYWTDSGRLSEGRRWLEDALARSTEEDGGDARANAVRGTANVAYFQGDLERALELHERDVDLRRRLGDAPELAVALNNLALDVQESGDWARARALYEESIALARDLRAERTLALNLSNLSLLAFHEASYDEAMRLAEESIAVSRDVGDTRTTALALSNLCSALTEQGRYEEARGALADCLELIETMGLRRLLIGAFAASAAIAIAEGRFAGAARMVGVVERVADDLGIRPALTESGDLDPARAAAREALGEDEFAAAVAEGRRLTDAEALQAAVAPASDA